MRTATSWIFLGGGCLKSTPEEKVRQRFIETLINEYHYPANTIRREVPIQHGSKELRDKDGNPVRADIVVYASKAACLTRDQGKINSSRRPPVCRGAVKDGRMGGLRA